MALNWWLSPAVGLAKARRLDDSFWDVVRIAGSARQVQRSEFPHHVSHRSEHGSAQISQWTKLRQHVVFEVGRTYARVMTPTDIIAALGAVKPVPVAAVRAGTDCADAIAPSVLAVVEKASGGALLLPDQQRLARRGVHVLAAARQTTLWQPLLRLLRRDRNELDRSLGQALTETLSSVLLSVFDGDVAPLLATIEDRATEEYARWAALGVLARLTFDGAHPRAATRALLERFEAEGWVEPGNAAWEGWQDAVQLLGFTQLAPRVRATWADGRNPQSEADQKYWEEQLAAGPADAPRFADDRLCLIEDAAAILQRLESAQQPQEAAAIAAREVDPIALDEDEIDWLHDFLNHTGAAMSAEVLDGYFTALVVGPEPVMPSEYLPEIWGDEEPVYDDREQGEFALHLLMRHWNSIAHRFKAHKPCAPIMADAALVARDWADGFMRGVSLRMPVWDRRLAKDEQLTTFLGHILMLTVDQDVAAKEGVTAEERTRMVESLPLAVHGLYLYWREKPITAHTSRAAARSQRSKVGRNAPCSCGSGKKYKRCCGAAILTIH